MERSQVTRAAGIQRRAAEHAKGKGGQRDAGRARRVDPFQQQERQTRRQPGFEAHQRPEPIDDRQDDAPFAARSRRQPQARHLARELAHQVEFIPDQPQRRKVAKEGLAGGRGGVPEDALVAQGLHLGFQGAKGGIQVAGRQGGAV